MATMEQIQELVTRIQAMVVRKQESASREQALQGQVQNLTTQLLTTQVGGAASGSGTYIDTRSLGKPEVFEGVEA
eukprot:6385340-Amphidinium_carterae.1